MLMNGTLPELIVLALGGSIAPPLLFLTVLFLGSCLQTWMGKNYRNITVVICLVFGTFLLLSGLLGA